MNSFSIEDGKITRDIHVYDKFYLKEDVYNLIEHWIKYYKEKLEKASEEKDKLTYDGAVWSLEVVRQELD